MRRIPVLLAILTVTLIGGAAFRAQQAQPGVVVYKTPTCGCCSLWIEHLRANGFDVKAVDVDDIESVKTTYGIPANLESCHTAVVANYAIEGHVPADAVQRLLRERPDVAGIAVPGMPIGSPGMEVGDRLDPYSIMSFKRDGTSAVFDRRP
jgi:hypothetical protein